jgi:hypothetical protein
VYSQLTDRGERIKTVLEAKPEATIKVETPKTTPAKKPAAKQALFSSGLLALFFGLLSPPEPWAVRIISGSCLFIPH